MLPDRSQGICTSNERSITKETDASSNEANQPWATSSRVASMGMQERKTQPPNLNAHPTQSSSKLVIHS
jgi:hypothetical protein